MTVIESQPDNRRYGKRHRRALRIRRPAALNIYNGYHNHSAARRAAHGSGGRVMTTVMLMGGMAKTPERPSFAATGGGFHAQTLEIFGAYWFRLRAANSGPWLGQCPHAIKAPSQTRLDF
jgi:hypothetical protein